MSFSISHILLVLGLFSVPPEPVPKATFCCLCGFLPAGLPEPCCLIRSPYHALLCLPWPSQSQDLVCDTFKSGGANVSIYLSHHLCPFRVEVGPGSTQGQGVCQLYPFGIRGLRAGASMAGLVGPLQGLRELALCLQHRSISTFSLLVQLSQQVAAYRGKGDVCSRPRIASPGPGALGARRTTHIKRTAW